MDKKLQSKFLFILFFFQEKDTGMMQSLCSVKADGHVERTPVVV